MGTTDNKNNNCFWEIISDLVDKGGYGGILKIILALVVFVILCFQKIPLMEIMWNVFILNIPCLIDCIEFSSVPKSELSMAFVKLRGWLIFLLTLAVSGAIFIVLVLTDIIKIQLNEEVLAWIFKFATSLSVSGAIFNYIGKIHTKEFQIKKSEKP